MEHTKEIKTDELDEKRVNIINFLKNKWMIKFTTTTASVVNRSAWSPLMARSPEKKSVAHTTAILMTIKSKPKVINMKGPSRSFKIGFKIKLKTLNINPTMTNSCHPPVIDTPSM